MKPFVQTLVLLILSCVSGDFLGAGIREARLRDAEDFYKRGRALMYEGQYAVATELAERCLALREGELGELHSDVSHTLGLLGSLWSQRGELSRAETLFKRALDIDERLLGPRAFDTASSLNNLAIVYKNQGNYSQAEFLFKRAIENQRGVLGKSDIRLSPALGNLAELYKNQGHYSQAESLMKEVLELRRSLLGEKDPGVTSAYYNLGVLYYKQLRLAESRQALEQARVWLERHPGQHGLLHANVLSSLAAVLGEQGEVLAAERLMTRALEMFEAMFGEKHVKVANVLGDLALLASRQGDPARAERLFTRVLELQESLLGPMDLGVATTLFNFAFAIEQWSHAGASRSSDVSHLDRILPMLERASNISETHLRQEVLSLSDGRISGVMRIQGVEEERLYDLLLEHADDERVRRLVLTSAFLRKGRSGEEFADTSRILHRSLGVVHQESLSRLRRLRTELSQLALTGPGVVAADVYPRRLEELGAQVGELAAELAEYSLPFRALYAYPDPSHFLEEVAKRLPADGALVQYVVSPWKDPEDKRYFALLLLPDGRTRALDLGKAEVINGAASRFHKALMDSGTSSDSPEAKALYGRVFAPLKPWLGQSRRLFISPEGQLSLIPFDALHDGHDVLLESFDISYLSSGKEMLSFRSEERGSQALVILAAPDYGSARAPTASTHAARTTRADASPTLAKRIWDELPGALQEARAIQALFETSPFTPRLLLGKDATKDALLAVARPSLLHIATHGFFIQDAATPTQGARKVGVFESPGGMNQSVRLDDPMLRSGLVLANANERGTDSRVTSLELAGMDLWGTQLVVLSACDTGRGDIRVGQGVYGLRRALNIAGAQTVVTSLWSVRDDSTAELMAAYYGHLKAGRGRLEALRLAMKDLRRIHPEPYFWAPFVGMGLDEPLMLGP